MPHLVPEWVDEQMRDKMSPAEVAVSSGSGVCECWRLTTEGYHGSRACPFYGMHWSEVAAITNREDGSAG